MSDNTFGAPRRGGLGDAEHALGEHRAAMGEIRELLGELGDLSRGYAEELRDFRAQMAARDEERAEQARDGLLGTDWQRIQRRIDAGETSLDAVVRGEDGSVEAEELRRTAAENSREIAALQEAEPEDPADDEQGEVFAQVRRQQAELQEMMAEIRRMRRPGVG